MPLVQRVVQPIDIVRIPLNRNLRGNDELRSVNMNALVGILRQLAGLSKHAESLFADLFNEATRTMMKARSMETRVQSLAERISCWEINLDSNININTCNVETGRLRHDVMVDQNVVTKDNRSLCVRERHASADPTPNLIVFKNIRDDGKNYATMYTDPHFFGKAWFLQMQSEYEHRNKQRSKTKKKKKTSIKKEPRPVTIKEYTYDQISGKALVIENQIRKVDRRISIETSSPVSNSGAHPDFAMRHDTLDATPPPLQPTDIELSDNLPPPPEFDLPPPFGFDEAYIVSDNNTHYRVPSDVPPPGPPTFEPVYDEPQPRAPPAPRAPFAPPAAPRSLVAPMQLAYETPGVVQRPVLKPPAPAPPPPEDEVKPKSLLVSIQNYALNTLKKVTVEQKAENHYASMDVMSILNRRVVMQVSDSESDTDTSEHAWDDD